MATLAEIRQKYPQYGDLSDQQFADALYAKHYSDMDRAEFDAQLGLSAPPAPAETKRLDDEGPKDEPLLVPDGPSGAYVLNSRASMPSIPGSKLASMPLAGLQDSAFQTIAAPADLMSGAMRAIGLPTPKPGFYADKLKSGWNWVAEKMGGHPEAFTPETTGEKALYGAGKGVGDAASILLPAAATARLAAPGSMTSRVAAALAEQPLTQVASGAVGGAVGEATDNPYAGMAASMAVPIGMSALGRLVSPNRSTLSPERQRLAHVLQNEGVDLSAAQQTDSRPLHAMESVFGTLPMTAGPEARRVASQQGQFNRAALSRAGINAEAATPDVMDAAYQRLGNEFNRVSAATTVNLDPQIQQELVDLANRYGRKLPSQQREVFQAYLDDIANLGTSMPGETYQVTRSDLTKQARAVANSDPYLSQTLRGLRNSLDDAADRSITPGMREAWDTARRQYANLKVLDRAVAGGGAAGAQGNIAPAQLYTAVRTQNPRFARGGGELNDLARAGQAFLRNPVPNSGTPERSMMQRMLQGEPLLAGGGALALGADLGTAGAVTAGSLVLPRIVQAMVNSGPGRAYLTNQAAVGRTPQATRALLAALLAEQGRQPLIEAMGEY